jgi:peptidoglycan hydrolase-like protein with peptidoglycan-binding domain
MAGLGRACGHCFNDSLGALPTDSYGPIDVTAASVNTLSKAKGSSGEPVKTLQRALTYLKFDPNSIDGKFGAGVDKAVRAFQTAKKLQVDGVVGRQMWATLRNTLSPESAVPVPPPGGAVGLPPAPVSVTPSAPPKVAPEASKGVPGWVWLLLSLAGLGAVGAVVMKRKTVVPAVKGLLGFGSSTYRAGVFIETAPYVRVHGKEPKGRGNWAFDIGREEPVFINNIYSLAREKAWQMALDSGHTVVKVLG